MSTGVAAHPETYRFGRTASGRVAHELTKANESASLCGTVTEAFLVVEDADDMPMCSRCDVISAAQLEEMTAMPKPSAAELKNDVENAIFALEGADSGEKITGLEEHAEETLLKIAAGPRAQLRMRLKEAVSKADDRLKAASKEAAVPDPVTEIEGHEALIAAGAEKIKKGVEFGLQATHAAEETAELQLAGSLKVLYRGLPDLKKLSAPAQALAKGMYAEALEGVDSEDAREAHKSLRKGVQNRSVDTTVRFLRSLNEGEPEDFAKIFPMVVVDEGESLEDAVRDQYATLGMTFPTLTRAEQAAELRAKAPKVIEGEATSKVIESSEAGTAVVATVKSLGSEARKITKTVKTMSDSEKDEVRKALRDAMTDMQKLLTELL